ncbi:hypothetical protein OHA74_21630 [Streptomyces phaeochromogenes]|uniref:hypothetical protein n=1 Tax=Streptomyces phaeochromogenes TaxID=1923 RepID=UPI002E2D987A|nr:hypothetical protein [Streptomyces phaeochromogenes]
MGTSKAFRPEFRTRDGKRVSFSAGYTHDTRAKRRAGLTKAGRPRVATVGAGTVVRRPRRWIPWAVFGVNSAALGGYLVVTKLGPVVGGIVIGAAIFVLYRAARWTMGEVAHWSVKSRQIRGGSHAVAEGPSGPTIDDIIANAPRDTVDYPDPK